VKTTGNTRIFVESFLDGFSFAGLIMKLSRPGSPTEVFDTRTEEEIRSSGDFDRLLAESEKR
jgi:hypothetical protein